MSHKAAVHFLEIATKRLDATLTQMKQEGQQGTDNFQKITQATADVRESIEILEMLDSVHRKANEIRRRKGN